MIILDILLPEMNGYEVLRKIREKGVVIPVICLTAKDEKEDIIKGLELGADDYLVKPFSFAELLARIKAVLRRGMKDVELSKLAVFDLSLDLINRKACRNGKDIELSGKQFLLLEYLMRNAEQILTRTMILENVWGYNFVGDDNIIEVYVGYLRKKMEADGELRLIQTVRGVGYVLREAC